MKPEKDKKLLLLKLQSQADSRHSLGYWHVSGLTAYILDKIAMIFYIKTVQLLSTWRPQAPGLHAVLYCAASVLHCTMPAPPCHECYAMPHHMGPPCQTVPVPPCCVVPGFPPGCLVTGSLNLAKPCCPILPSETGAGSRGGEAEDLP